jgi:class 3 adenylate cyclase
MPEDSFQTRFRPELIAYLDSFATAEPQAVLPAWLRHRWLFRVPASVATTDKRVYIIRLLMLMVAGAIHVGLALIFAVFGRWTLMAVNLTAILWYVLAVAVFRTGRQHTAMFLGFLEAFLHGFAFTLLFGLRAGYEFYNFAFLVVAFPAYRSSEWRARLSLVVLSVLTALVEIVATHFLDPVIVLRPTELDVLCYLNVVGALLGGVLTVYYFATAAQYAQKKLERALARSEDLLLNVLPRPIAERLKRKPGTIADSFSSVTVLFADIVGFTPLAAGMSSTAVVEMLGDLFSAFDHFAECHGVEKIKTIGDAYLAVGGLPEPRLGHAAAVCALALDMQDFMRQYAARMELPLALRIGIHTGPVVAGVIGQKKFSYDLWGDTVNIASRMESQGLPGCIQISEAVLHEIHGRYKVQERGAVTVKGRGEMMTWLLCGARDQATPGPAEKAPLFEATMT